MGDYYVLMGYEQVVRYGVWGGEFVVVVEDVGMNLKVVLDMLRCVLGYFILEFDGKWLYFYDFYVGGMCFFGSFVNFCMRLGRSL